MPSLTFRDVEVADLLEIYQEPAINGASGRKAELISEACAPGDADGLKVGLLARLFCR